MDCPSAAQPAPPWLGRSLERFEDAALLTGRGRYFDDVATPAGTLHAAILRSPHGHATIAAIDTAQAVALPGVAAVLTGRDIQALTSSLVVGVKAPMECWPIATDRVRYMGEPVAIAVATDRYIAEDALDLIEVRYDRLPAVTDPLAALQPDAPVLHPGLGGNLASDRRFRYGDPEAAFASAPHRVSVEAVYPRNACTPIETYGVLAEYDPSADCLRRAGEFPGAVLAACGDRAGVAGAGQPAAAAHAAGFRRQLRGEAGRVPLHRADRRRRARDGPAGEMGRGPAGAPRRLRLRHQPGHHAACRGGRRWAGAGAGLGPGRGLRCPSARAGTGDAVSHAWQHDRRLRHPAPGDPQPGGADQQDAHRAEPRLRRAAGLFRAGTADAAHRGDAASGPAGRDPPQPCARIGFSLPHRQRRAAGFR